MQLKRTKIFLWFVEFWSQGCEREKFFPYPIANRTIIQALFFFSPRFGIIHSLVFSNTIIGRIRDQPYYLYCFVYHHFQQVCLLIINKLILELTNHINELGVMLPTTCQLVIVFPKYFASFSPMIPIFTQGIAIIFNHALPIM